MVLNECVTVQNYIAEGGGGFCLLTTMVAIIRERLGTGLFVGLVKDCVCGVFSSSFTY